MLVYICVDASYLSLDDRSPCIAITTKLWLLSKIKWHANLLYFIGASSTKFCGLYLTMYDLEIYQTTVNYDILLSYLDSQTSDLAT